METIPKNAIAIDVEGATVDFYETKYKEETYYYFDTSQCPPPEPMINAMAGLQLLDKNKKLIMINHKPPMALFPRIQQNFNYKIEELEDGTHKIEFSYKNDTLNKTDFTNNFCNGG